MRIKTILLALCCMAFTAGTTRGLAATAATEPRFDIEVVDAPARAFFTGLASRGGGNLLVHPEVKGSITMTLRAVTVSEILDATRELYGYDYRHLPAGYFVLPVALRTQFYTVNYLDMSRSGSSRTSVSSGSITESKGMSATSNSTSTATTGNTGSTGSESTASLTGTVIVSQTQADFWGQIESNLKSIISADAERRIIVNRQSGVVAVRASPDELRSVSEYLRRVQSTATRQVILEAKILEVDLSDAYQAGINWAAVLKHGGDTYTLGAASPPGGFDANLLNTAGRNTIVGPGNPLTQFAATTLGSAFTLAIDTSDVNAVIDLLKVQGNTRVLSSPRVATLHNQKAVIKAGTDELFVTGVKSNTVTGTATSSSREVELTPFFSGVALDVTPQIGDDGEVILHVHPSVSEVRDQTKRLTVNGQTDELPLAVSEIRESDSVVRARSGQVVVIGGMMRSTRGAQNFATPFMSSIPGLGNLFKSKRNLERKTELVILLKPLVVDGTAAVELAAADAARVNAVEATFK
jgi:MSHA biogenesis protein MshL